MKADGLKQCGKKDGKLRFQARITGRDPDTGEKVVDTERYILADTRGEARTLRDKLTKELLDKKLGRSKDIARIKFADAVEQWRETITRHSTWRNWGSHARRMVATFGNDWLDALTFEKLQGYIAGLQKAGLDPGTVGGHRAAMVSIFEWAIDNGHARRPNPARDTRVKTKRSAAKVLSELETPTKRKILPSELGGFMAALRERDPQMAVLVTAMLSIGVRYAEGSVIKRADVNWKTGELVIKRGHVRGHLGPPKNDGSREVAFPPSILELLRGHVAEMDRLKWPGHQEWLFPSRPRGRRGPLPIWSYSSVARAIKAAKDAAGVHTDNTTHAIRHSTAGLIKGQIEDSVMRGVMGWASAEMQDNYGGAPVLEFAKRMDELLGAVDGKSKKKPRAG